MAEWTEQQVYEQLAQRSVEQAGQRVLRLADIEAVVFDARFPQHLLSWADQLMKRFEPSTYE